MLEDSREELRELPREELKGHHEERTDGDLSLSSSRGIMFEAFSSASFVVDDDDDGSFGSLATGVSSLESFAKSEAAFGSDMVERTRRSLSGASERSLGNAPSTYTNFTNPLSLFHQANARTHRSAWYQINPSSNFATSISSSMASPSSFAAYTRTE